MAHGQLSIIFHDNFDLMASASFALLVCGGIVLQKFPGLSVVLEIIVVTGKKQKKVFCVSRQRWSFSRHFF